MNYRHHYHAGNFADIMKHTVLAVLLEALNRKPAPWCYYDSHAGAGGYDLHSDAAVKTGEAAGGIGCLWRLRPEMLPPPLARLRTVVADCNPQADSSATPRFYPGSPLLAAAFARPGDRLVLAELHPQDAQRLKAHFHADRRVAVHRRDGYGMLTALLPPVEHRGLVLMDPPFENADEFARLAEAAVAAHRRWPTGMYALWYPVKEEAAVRRFQRALKESGIRRILLLEFGIAPAETPGLSACGMAVVNPPWRSDHSFAAALDFLARALGSHQSRNGVRWLTGE